MFVHTVIPSSLAPANNRFSTMVLVALLALDSCNNKFVASSKPSSEHDLDVNTCHRNSNINPYPAAVFY